MPPLLALLLDERPRPLVPFEWSWSLHPSVLLGTGLLGALYVWGIGPLRRRRSLGPPVERWRIASFAGGLLVILTSLNGPIHDLSDDYLFSAHMLQHMLLTLLFPPLLIAGTPGWLLSLPLRHAALRRTARVLTRPVTAAALYSATLVVWHLPPFYNRMTESHGVHIFSHLTFMASATLMWWPVMSRVPELPRLTPGVGMLYLFLVGIPMQIVAAFITMADEVLYPWYSAAPRTFGLSPLDDQVLGGLLMWVPGNLWMFLAIGVLFFQWARESR